MTSSLKLLGHFELNFIYPATRQKVGGGGGQQEKVCIFGQGPMTKMAAMPIILYDKNLKKSSSPEPLS